MNHPKDNMLNEMVGTYFKKLDEEGEIVILVTGERGSKAYFAYVSMLPSKYLSYKEAEKQGAVRVTDFGKVIEHGFGSPSKELKAKLEESHKLDHNLEAKLQEMMEKVGSAANG